MEQLAGIYFGSVGHNATLLLNVPPNKQGTVDADILARVAEFGKQFKIRLIRTWLKKRLFLRQK